MTPDAELLATFARTNSEAAFAELVQRHVNLVYSAALRQVNGDEHLAKDVAQMVFTGLARKANSLSRRETLAGWLYTSAHFAAAKMLRGENRRRDREEKFMREPENSGMGVPPVQSANEIEWEKIRPALDDAMHELKATDREAVLLRYFENRPFAEVGAKLGLNENAARMRVERALEKLRGVFARRGIATATALASVISAHAIQTAPANLAATLTTASIATAGTGTFTLLKIMTATKLKLAFSALVVAGAATAFVIQHQAQEKLRADNESLTQQLAQLHADNETLSNRFADIGGSKKLSDEQFNELLKLRGEVGVLRRQVGDFGKLHEENQRLRTQNSAAQSHAVVLTPEEQFKLQEFHTVNAMKMLGLAMRIYAGDHNDQYATNFDQLKNELGGVTNFPGNISLDAVEFVNTGLVNDAMPDKIIFRERVPRQLSPDGGWQRIYGLADGSVQTIYSSSDGNFDDFEKPRLVSPPNQ
jgi:RNA polymerase sigma factor (sigma-70 family)